MSLDHLKSPGPRILPQEPSHSSPTARGGPPPFSPTRPTVSFLGFCRCRLSHGPLLKSFTQFVTTPLLIYRPQGTWDLSPQPGVQPAPPHRKVTPRPLDPQKVPAVRSGRGPLPSHFAQAVPSARSLHTMPSTVREPTPAPAQRGRACPRLSQLLKPAPKASPHVWVSHCKMDVGHLPS